MARYLVQATYSPEGIKGLLKEGGSARREGARKLAEEMGGSLECWYYAYGETDVFAVFDLPDSVTATAISLAVNASGAGKVRFTPLISPEEVDEATKKAVNYRPPGR